MAPLILCILCLDDVTASHYDQIRWLLESCSTFWARYQPVVETRCVLTSAINLKFDTYFRYVFSIIFQSQYRKIMPDGTLSPEQSIVFSARQTRKFLNSQVWSSILLTLPNLILITCYKWNIRWTTDRATRHLDGTIATYSKTPLPCCAFYTRRQAHAITKTPIVNSS